MSMKIHNKFTLYKVCAVHWGNGLGGYHQCFGGYCQFIAEHHDLYGGMSSLGDNHDLCEGLSLVLLGYSVHSGFSI